MQRTLLLKSFLVALVFLVSVPWAQAQRRGGGGAGRINKLSGPGPFHFGTFFYGFPLACDYDDKVKCQKSANRVGWNGR